MHIQQAVIDQKFAQELFAVVPEILKSLPLTGRLFKDAPDLEARINASCLALINRLDTRHELFKDKQQISGDARSAAYSAMMALHGLPEFQHLLDKNSMLYGALLEILQGRFTESAVKKLT